MEQARSKETAKQVFELFKVAVDLAAFAAFDDLAHGVGCLEGALAPGTKRSLPSPVRKAMPGWGFLPDGCLSLAAVASR